MPFLWNCKYSKGHIGQTDLALDCMLHCRESRCELRCTSFEQRTMIEPTPPTEIKTLEEAIAMIEDRMRAISKIDPDTCMALNISPGAYNNQAAGFPCVVDVLDTDGKCIREIVRHSLSEALIKAAKYLEDKA